MLPPKCVKIVLPDVNLVNVHLKELVMLDLVLPLTWKPLQLLVQNVLITAKYALKLTNVLPVLLVGLKLVTLVLNVIKIVQHVLLLINVILVNVMMDID